MAGNEEIKSNENINAAKPDKEPMVMPTDFDLAIVNMDKVLYEAKAKSVIAPGPLGDFAILPGHTPLFTILRKGKLIIEGEENMEIEIEDGIARITQFKVTILIGF